jgi:hypothetical protein
MARDTSFQDLTAGSRLRIVTPLSNSENGKLDSSAMQQGNTIVLSAPNLAGYKMSHYLVKGRTDGTVRLVFDRAEVSRNGETRGELIEPKLPFSLPKKRRHLRLLYLVRQSQSDHNMAILAAKHLSELNSFTERLKKDPSVCSVNGDIFCSWVPSGFAVRAE